MTSLPQAALMWRNRLNQSPTHLDAIPFLCLRPVPRDEPYTARVIPGFPKDTPFKNPELSFAYRL